MFSKNVTQGKNPAVEERRLGRFAYSHEFIVTTPPKAVQNLFGKVIPVKVEFDYANQLFNVVAFSELFEPVDTGAQIPQYQVLIRVTGAGKKRVSYHVSFTQVEQHPLAALFG